MVSELVDNGWNHRHSGKTWLSRKSQSQFRIAGSRLNSRLKSLMTSSSGSQELALLREKMVKVSGTRSMTAYRRWRWRSKSGYVSNHQWAVAGTTKYSAP